MTRPAILEVLDGAVPDFEVLIKFENLLRNREDELAAAWGRRPDDLKEGSPGWDPRFIPEWPESAEQVMLRCMLGKVASLLCGWYAVRPVAVFDGCRGLHNCWGYEAWKAGLITVGDVADAGPEGVARVKGIGPVKLAAVRRFMVDYGFWEENAR